ncbi:DUF4192 domain-containing protein [Spongisporangium articulatum]|uniref:DUF4192 domain-containing protein n=1 Tax=Spongisporangium articulatum TaxID=3362603 RepID=A0ABW8AME9_9ACTN
MTSSAMQPGPGPDEDFEYDVVLSGSGPADAVAAVWYRLGYKPAESLVMVAVHEPKGRLGLTLRGDVPPDLPGRRELIRQLYQPIRAAGAVRVLVMLFQADLFDARPGRAPGSRPSVRVAQLRDEVRRLGGSVMDVIGVGRDSYRSLDCRDRTCCPAAGFPIAEIETSRAAATFTVAGRALVSSMEGLLDDVQPEPFAGAPAEDPGPWTVADRLGWWERWAAAFDADQLGDGEVAALGPTLDDPWLRDAVVLAGLGGDRDVVRAGLHLSEDGWDGFLTSGGGPEYDRVLALDPETEHRAALLERSRVVLAAVARRSAPGARGGALAVLALHAWYQGDTTRARLLVERALADRPGQSLARLVGQLLLTGTAPGWLPPAWVTRPGVTPATSRARSGPNTQEKHG